MSTRPGTTIFLGCYTGQCNGLAPQIYATDGSNSLERYSVVTVIVALVMVFLVTKNSDAASCNPRQLVERQYLDPM